MTQVEEALPGRRVVMKLFETMGLYWHFVDLVWVFFFAFFIYGEVNYG
ncbi:MAG: hypothetical protein CM15mP109_02170 [Candidatus Dadabacteria bacterium]|nr:MAG: hypothetical protein CM15mP109_02170 [Candidatus Dadabacteria bacterium]